MLLGQTTRFYGFSIWFVILIALITINSIKAMTQLFFVLFKVLLWIFLNNPIYTIVHDEFFECKGLHFKLSSKLKLKNLVVPSNIYFKTKIKNDQSTT